MTTPTLENHVSKTEAAQIYRRGLRSLTRDISKALTHRDESVLSNWRLKTIDGKIRQGTEVTSEEVETLHSTGMVPTWWGYQPYLESRYGRRDSETEAAQASQQPHDKETPRSSIVDAASNARVDSELPPLPKDDAEAVEVLKDFSMRLLNDLVRERTRYDEVIPVIKNMPEQHKDTMAVLKGLQDTLKNAQFIGLSDEDKKAITTLLDSGTPPTASQPPAPPKRSSEGKQTSKQADASEGESTASSGDMHKTEVIDVQPGEEAPQQPSRTTTQPQSSTRKSSGKRSGKKKPSPSKQGPKKAKASKKKASTTKNTQPWYKRDVRSFFVSNS